MFSKRADIHLAAAESEASEKLLAAAAPKIQIKNRLKTLNNKGHSPASLSAKAH
jgi:hypothetical protein